MTQRFKTLVILGVLFISLMVSTATNAIASHRIAERDKEQDVRMDRFNNRMLRIYGSKTDVMEIAFYTQYPDVAFIHSTKNHQRTITMTYKNKRIAYFTYDGYDNNLDDNTAEVLGISKSKEKNFHRFMDEFQKAFEESIAPQQSFE